MTPIQTTLLCQRLPESIKQTQRSKYRLKHNYYILLHFSIFNILKYFYCQFFFIVFSYLPLMFHLNLLQFFKSLNLSYIFCKTKNHHICISESNFIYIYIYIYIIIILIVFFAREASYIYIVSLIQKAYLNAVSTKLQQFITENINICCKKLNRTYVINKGTLCHALSGIIEWQRNGQRNMPCCRWKSTLHCEH